MKIGEFAKANHVTIDTIRHYIDLGLLLPRKPGGQYVFDENTTKRLADILDYKEMGFSLYEIKTIFLYQQLGKLSGYDKDEFYQNLYLGKLEELEKEIKHLEHSRRKLVRSIDQFEIVDRKRTFGLEMNHLNKLFCNKCGKQMILETGSIEDNMIINGQLSCTCNNHYLIEDGIIMVGRGEESQFEDDFLSKYIQTTDPAFLDNLYRSIRWGQEVVDFQKFDDKIILELGSGSGFLLRNIYEILPKTAVYIAIDHDLARHKMLKRMIERSEVKRSVIFICADFLDMPVQKGSVDVLIDSTGSSNYSFDHEEFLLDEVRDFLKEDVYLLGSYILFEKFMPESLIPLSFRQNFILDNIQKGISRLGFEMISDETSNLIENGGVYENYFIEGEKVYNYLYFGKRRA